jgi:uncharacterized protein (UPF0332 family)
MTYNQFVKEYLEKGLLTEQKTDFSAIGQLILRAMKDLKTAKANLDIDEGVAYTVAYTGMLRSGRALMLLKGFRPADGFQHKTVVEFTAYFLSDKFKMLADHFDKMRRKRNIFTYEVNIAISRTEADNALNTATQFIDAIKGVIKKENPQIEIF